MTYPPADDLRAAAEKLRTAATAADTKRPAPWSPGAAGSVLSPREGGVDYVTGYTINSGPQIAAYIALMHPGVGTALAQWLDTAAEGFDTTHYARCTPETCIHAAALAVARAINGDAR